MNRYLLARRRHRLAASSDLWLSAKGRFTDSGVRQMLERRCDAAGIARMHPHQFRHTWAHLCKSRGMNDDDLMTLGAWRSREMLARYGRSAADERA